MSLTVHELSESNNIFKRQVKLVCLNSSGFYSVEFESIFS